MEREFENLRLQSEEVAEFNYRPVACRKTYRMIVVRKNLSVEKGEVLLFPDERYFFYITNDWDSTATEIVFRPTTAAIRRTCWRSCRAACGRCARRWTTWTATGRTW